MMSLNGETFKGGLMPPIFFALEQKRKDSWAIVSEPFDENHNGWTKMESNSFYTFDQKDVFIQKLI